MNSITHVVSLREKQYEDFLALRLENTSKLRSATITKNKLPLMNYKQKAEFESGSSSAKAERVNTVQILVVWESNKRELFSHETSCTPPALSRKGGMFHGTKGDIVRGLEA